MDVLAVIHGSEERSGVFGEVVAARGHALEEWRLADGAAPQRPVGNFGAVIVFGGAMHADQDAAHPWLPGETELIQGWLAAGTPLLGVCLGAQLMARAAGAPVHPAAAPEIGWTEVELTAAGRNDAVLGTLPARFEAFQWHYYTYGVPAGAPELATSALCTQAFRFGERAWGIQFHPEVTGEMVRDWVCESPGELPLPPAEFLARLDTGIERWNELGRGLCESFLAVAERA